MNTKWAPDVRVSDIYPCCIARCFRRGQSECSLMKWCTGMNQGYVLVPKLSQIISIYASSKTNTLRFVIYFLVSHWDCVIQFRLDNNIDQNFKSHDVGKCGSSMTTSLIGSIFRVTCHLCGEFTGHRWIPRTKASDAELWCFPWSAPE